mmetsp:Transcript_26446/g.55579  ORF Transcript_26446/g.55579 Transcript_26446/m.55579 type:complete len:275 (+) Transcript_26446:678-1502(+)
MCVSWWRSWFGRKTGCCCCCCCPIRNALFENVGGTRQPHPCEPSRRASIGDLPPGGRWTPFSRRRRRTAESCKSPTARIGCRPPASTIPTVDRTQNPVETPRHQPRVPGSFLSPPGPPPSRNSCLACLRNEAIGARASGWSPSVGSALISAGTNLFPDRRRATRASLPVKGFPCTKFSSEVPTRRRQSDRPTKPPTARFGSCPAAGAVLQSDAPEQREGGIERHRRFSIPEWETSRKSVRIHPRCQPPATIWKPQWHSRCFPGAGLSTGSVLPC